MCTDLPLAEGSPWGQESVAGKEAGCRVGLKETCSHSLCTPQEEFTQKLTQPQAALFFVWHLFCTMTDPLKGQIPGQPLAGKGQVA